MNSNFDVSIVVSSYNRDDKVLETLERLFESDLAMFENVELIVIDDGSPRPLENLLPQIKDVPPKINFRLITQTNSGIGATRNRGFREAQSPLVIFLDDDILVEKDTLKKFYEAFQTAAGDVIFGAYPFVTHESQSLHRFARKLYGYDEVSDTVSFTKVDAITSGLLFVNKAKLNGMESFYRDDMTIPAAEEHEIISRFHKLKIPIYYAAHIHAIHNHHLELEWLVQQQYKYGQAAAEALAKNPEMVEMKKMRELQMTLATLRKSGLKNYAKRLIASNFGRKMTFRLAQSLEKLFPKNNHDFIFGLTTTAYFWGGYLDGHARFSN